MCKILDQYADKIKGTFSFFDRMINGYFRPFLSGQMRGWALYQLGVLNKDFLSDPVDDGLVCVLKALESTVSCL